MLVITRILFTLLLGVVSVSFFNVALAASVAPSVLDVVAEPGEFISEEFIIFHSQNQSVEYSIDLLLVDLGADEDGISFAPLPLEMQKWIEIDKSYLVVQSGEIGKVYLNIDVSGSSASLSRVIGVRIIELKEGSDAINVQTGNISLIFLTVGDDFKNGARLLDFSAGKKVLSSLPVSFRTTVRNEGQRFLQLQGSVTVRNMFGNVVSSYNVNEEGKRIPSNQQRTYSVQWGETGASDPSQDQLEASFKEDEGFINRLKNETEQFAFGLFKAELNIETYDGGENITATTSVFIFPWRFLLVVTVVFALFYGLVRILRKK